MTASTAQHDRRRVDELKCTALLRAGSYVMLDVDADPVNGTRAALELLPGAKFSHLRFGCPVYTLEGPRP